MRNSQPRWLTDEARDVFASKNNYEAIWVLSAFNFTIFDISCRVTLYFHLMNGVILCIKNIANLEHFGESKPLFSEE